MDFIEIVNRIFINKSKYHEITDDDKINSFFIINRKFGKSFPDFSKKFNHKNIDKASAIDLWFDKFKHINKIPTWYWDPKDRIKPSKIKKNDYDDIKFREDLDDEEIIFLEKYFEEDLKKELRNIKKYE